MNAMEQITAALVRPAAQPVATRPRPAQAQTTAFRDSSDRYVGAGLVAKLRDYLYKNGPASAAVLKDVAGCAKSGTVSAVLKHDRRIGRVVTYMESGRMMYRLRDGDPAVFRMISRLEALGYTVSKK